MADSADKGTDSSIIPHANFVGTERAERISIMSSLPCARSSPIIAGESDRESFRTPLHAQLSFAGPNAICPLLLRYNTADDVKSARIRSRLCEIPFRGFIFRIIILAVSRRRFRRGRCH